MLRDASPQPELPAIGIDIVRVSRIAGVLQRHPTRFETRVLTDAERAYVRARPETMSGRWAAKEAVSKVLGLGIRGIGWREIETDLTGLGQAVIASMPVIRQAVIGASASPVTSMRRPTRVNVARPPARLWQRTAS